MLKALFCSIFFFGCSHTLTSQLPKPFDTPADNGLIRGYLESDFSLLLANCKIAPLRVAHQDGQKVIEGDVISAVPVTLQQNLSGFNRAVPGYFDRSPGTVFSLIYFDSERKKGHLPFFETKRILPGDYIQDPVAMLPSGASAVFYSHSCSSVLNAAIGAKVGVTFPIATFSSALQDQFGDTRKTVLSMTEGHFTSPLNEYFHTTDPVKRDYGLFLAWGWYALNPERATLPNWWLTAFDGLALYQLSSEKASNSGSVTLGGSVASPFASSEASLKLAITQDTTTKIDRYETFMYTDPDPAAEWGHFEQLPSAADVAKAISASSTVLDPFTSVISSGTTTPYQVMQHLDGVPRSQCEPGLWKLSDEIANGSSLYSLDLQAVQPTDLTNDGKIDTPAPTGCMFTVSFKPRPAFFAHPVTALKYDFVYQAPPGVALPALSLSADQVPLTTTSGPIVRAASHDPTAKSSPGTDNAGNPTTILTWTISLAVDDKSDAVDMSGQVDLSGGTDPNSAVEAQCPDKLHSPVFDSITADFKPGANNPKVLTLTLIKTIHNFDQEDVTVPPIKCNVLGTIGLPMAAPLGANRIVTKPVPANVTILYPGPKSAHPAQASASGIGTTTTSEPLNAPSTAPIRPTAPHP